MGGRGGSDPPVATMKHEPLLPLEYRRTAPVESSLSDFQAATESLRHILNIFPETPSFSSYYLLLYRHNFARTRPTPRPSYIPRRIHQAAVYHNQQWQRP